MTNDDTMTLNDVLMDTKIVAWHISKNLPLVKWVQLGNKKRMFFDELGEDAEAAFQYVSNSAAAAVAAAAAAGVKTLSQWNNISVEKQKEIMSETMLSCLHSRIEEWFQCKWKEFVEVVNKSKTEPNFMLNYLTYHHEFKIEGSTVAMLGNERNQHVKSLLSDMEVYLEHTTSQTKEMRPIYCVVAASRQGKSLLLDVMCSNLRDIGIFAICISYNSDTPHSEADSSHTVAPRFWARVILSVARTCGIHFDWADFEKLSFISLLTIDRVMDFIKVCSPNFRRGRIVIAADEFSRVNNGLRLNTHISESQCHEILSSITRPLYSFASSALIVSGFKVSDHAYLATHSGRPSKYLWLSPSLLSDRSEYAPMTDEIKGIYNEKFPFIIYEWTKFSPGMLGLWLENLDHGEKPFTIEHLTIPILDVLSGSVQKQPDFFSLYWRECFNLTTTNLFKLPCLSKYEDCGTIIHTSLLSESLRGFLNPYIIIHPKISQHYHKEGELFNDLRKAFEREPWDTHAKGDALEKMLVSALQLRQIHTEGALPFNKVIGALCGKKNHQFFSSHEHDMVTFRSTVATGVETFPCHDATILRKAGDKNEGDEKANLTSKDDRKRNAIDAVQRHGIIHPICLMNRGCDVILVLDFKDQNKGITLVFFETKYFYHGSSLKRKTPAQKAYHVFEGLLDRSEPLGKCKVSHVCFTLCLTSGKEVMYDLKYKKYENGPTLNELIEQLGKKGISVSLHSVTTIEEWMHLITPPFFYALPAIEGKATKKRKRN